jgi:splicing factor 1
MKADPTFKPPTDVYAGRGGRFGRPSDKVYIPVKEFPEINFFGLLVGPRGNTLKTMERQSGAKISIRGKGSVKEGKQRPGDFPNDEDDELHCLVMADDEAKVRACVALINKVIETVSYLFARRYEQKLTRLGCFDSRRSERPQATPASRARLPERYTPR